MDLARGQGQFRSVGDTETSLIVCDLQGPSGHYRSFTAANCPQCGRPSSRRAATRCLQTHQANAVGFL
jgi:hypothetical protein